MWCAGFMLEMFNRVRVLILLAVLMVAGMPASIAGPYLVIDADTKLVISHEDAHRRWAPASLTKMMTAYVTFSAIRLQHLSFKSPVTMTARAIIEPPSKMGYPPGTVFTIDQAIKIILVKSANDVAMALGEAVGGSEEKFVALMNSHARRLGMTNTNFANPNGLPDDTQYTSAVDMARLTLAIQKDFPQHAHYFKIPGLKSGRRRLRNYNRLLTRFKGTTGMKTGFVCASGYNVVVTNERKVKQKTRRLIAIVMGARTGRARNALAAQLLTEAYEKPAGFVLYNLENLPAELGINLVPADITEDVCRGKKRSKAQREAAKKDKKTKKKKVHTLSLKEREKKYLSKPFNIGEYLKIRLGRATGPNPHGIRVSSTGGTPKDAIATPNRKPLSECDMKTPAQLAETELPKIKIKKISGKKKRRKKSRKKKKRSAVVAQILSCIPRPMAKPVLEPIDGLEQVSIGAGGARPYLPTKRPEAAKSE
ncbi:MAG: D-alanyl-D-alanine carboxypeptidase [Hyphomicrobiales bacterium]|nr:MAG: D-alanyl-D-alanine carboxypeptidase [Hyphomicrobiales bacterium]